MVESAHKETRDTGSPPKSEAPPQENTPAETGIPKVPGRNVGSRRMIQELEKYTSTSPRLTGGDVDAAWEQADSVGEEAVGGTVATPDQSVVDQLGAAVGLEMDDSEFLHTTEILETRDDKRWELDPMSSEDYHNRRD
ncbi:DUF6335 family protein [Kamptonema formosum]|uniref:DUF6335 family protein n=1 Tax=Kamptonema formosum TaxID=331992 RepID=UPI00037B651D|nr:DUF6335 family protein [Oscillatoria sp. PCC 10802]